jgi:CRISPR-associated protein Csb2
MDGGGATPGPDTVRLRLTEPGPTVALTATVAEAARAMVYRAWAGLFGDTRADACLHGPEDPDAPPDGRHLHAFWLPEDADGDGRIDRLTVFAEGGLTLRARQALTACRTLRVDGFGETPLRPEPAPQPQPARLWLAATPYVSWRFARRVRGGPVRAGRSAAQQLAAEIALRRRADGRPLPPVAVLDHPAPPAPPEAFRLGARAAADADLRERGWFALLFERPLSGPLCFGEGAHFGLGRFTPVADPAPR